ncbi:MAG: hypothetical protein HW400_343 [Candidatus Levybacteria bacterium]|nr:hypothetical protein [Candidatus Levybacteria bacterium]
MEEVKTEESWNKKRIFIAIILLALLIIGGYFFKTRALGENLFRQVKSVKGISSQKQIAEPAFNLNIQDTVKEKINSLKQEVAGLDIIEIASSSPQVQKILNDVKSLEQYPTNQLKEICRKICGL